MAALMVAMMLMGVILLVALGALASLFSKPPPSVPSNSVLVLDLNMRITDSPQTDPFEAVRAALRDEDWGQFSLREVLDTIEKAEDDDRINGILLIGNLNGGGYANSVAALTELRSKLKGFQESGKKLWSYLDVDGLGELYLKSVADEVWMNPHGYLDFKGLASEQAYWADAFKRFGIEVQVFRAGKYKSYAESLVASTMSDENREALESLLNDIWGSILESMVGEASDVSVKSLDHAASNLALFDANEALNVGLADALVETDEMIDKLIAQSGFDAEFKTFTQIEFSEYVASGSSALEMFDVGGGSQIAVVYAEGPIVIGEGEIGEVGGDSLSRTLRKVRKDDSIKAVVLRVNSPGGSAAAAEKIVREVELLRDRKPLIVSMGGYAASGGYMISCLADTIFTENSTITGSIGVVGLIPNIEQLAANLDVNFQRVETNEKSTLFSFTRSKTPAELARLQDFTDRTYDTFVAMVARGREMEVSEVEQVAQGRVWSGVAALQNGLADRPGGLEDAVAYAADLAGLGSDYKIRDFPKKKNLEEAISEMFSTRSDMTELFGTASPVGPVLEDLRRLGRMNDPRGVYLYAPTRIQW